MFNKKVLSVIAYVLAGLLILKTLFVVTMFVWQYYGAPPVPVFGPPGQPTLVTYLVLVQEIATAAFIYFLLGVFLKHTNHMKPGVIPHSIAPQGGTKPAAKRPRKRTRSRKTTKK